VRLRNVKNKEEILKSTTYLEKEPESNKGKWKEVFNNSNDIHIEIGMGKGDFIIENALTYPNINFIGIEKYDSVIARAIEKLNDKELPNLRLIRMDANKIDEVFDKEISEIYLNFSDPWPKKRHAKRRLTHESFLTFYNNLFKNKCHIIMKTDNDDLYEFSKESFINFGYKINKDIKDLHKENIFNIETEYEKKFSSLGFTIKYLDVEKDNL
jgi:tRNA (guanine-N7-)-methyltransferase